MDEQDRGRLLDAIHANQGSRLFDRAQDTTDPCPTAGNCRTPQPKKPACSSGKPRFATEQSARDRLAEVYGRSFSGRPYGPTDVYPCAKCGGWHLTAKPGKPWKHGKRSPRGRGRR